MNDDQRAISEAACYIHQSFARYNKLRTMNYCKEMEERDRPHRIILQIRTACYKSNEMNIYVTIIVYM